jgi:uncharacterized protein YndB with AHSA1/START domain
MKSRIDKAGDRLQLTRVFDATRRLVFGMWTDARRMEQWSGCKEMTRCDVAMDFRVGGSFTQTMQLAVHGTTCEFTVTGTYDEIVEPDRIVYHAVAGDVRTRVTVEFFDHPQGTKVVLTHEGCPNESFRDNVSQGTSDSFDVLDTLLASHAMTARQ